MKRISLVSLLAIVTLSINAQLYNNGALIKIQPGAVIKVTGNVQNAAGTITNDGKIELTGSFTNAGTYTTSTADDSLILTGGDNVSINSGASSLTNLQINKTANTNIVTLVGTTLLTGKLDYTSGTLTTDPINNPAYVLSSPTTAVYSFAAGREIIGSVRRTGWVTATPTVFNQPEMQVTTNGGTVPTSFTVTMIPLGGGGDPSLAEREVKRKFQFAQSGGAGFTTDVRFPYTADELNNNAEATLVPWELIAAEWNGRLTPITRDATNNWVATTGITTTALANEWKLADARYTFNVSAYLKGAWNNPTALMRTLLNSNGLIPLSQPYNTAAFNNYAGTESVVAMPNANVVDWVLLELRKPASGLPVDAVPGTIIGRKAVFLLSNGAIVDLDGVTPAGFDISKQGAAFVVVRHRNHLAAMSNSIPSNDLGTFTNDFSVLANSYKNPSATSDATSQLTPTGAGSTRWGLWPGDVNASRTITNSDVSPINTALIGPPSGNTSVYNPRDTNLDRNVTNADVSIVNSSLVAFAVSSVGKVISPYWSSLRSHVPGD